MSVPTTTEKAACQIILSFDVEEHDRIEAAAHLTVSTALKATYADRMASTTSWLLDELASAQIRCTFYVVGEIARSHPQLVRAMHQAGHEVASHSHAHKRLHTLTPESFRSDLRASKAALEEVTGAEVVGFRAPTFSLVPETAWALTVLAEEGFRYDSSIYPVRHDRYGIPQAPRAPFLAQTEQTTLLEIPPATWRWPGVNLPVGGGGYFRLFPLWVMEHALAQTARQCQPAVAMLYFHPWEFDLDQPHLPLGKLSRFRTYVGIKHTRARLRTLFTRYRFARAVDVAQELSSRQQQLPTFAIPPVVKTPA